MKLFTNRTVVFVCILSLAIFSCSAINAQSTEREKQLESLVKQLLQRVDELENRLDENDAKQTSLKETVEASINQTKEESEEDPSSIDWNWKNGLNFGTKDGNYKFKIGGRIHNDWYAGSIDDGDYPDGTRFRRLWISTNGTIYDDFYFRIQYDLSGGGLARFKDVYMGYTGLDFMNIRIGQFKEPFSMEELIASNYYTIMDQSPLNALTPSRETGLMLYNEILDKRMTWAIGAFHNSNDFGDGEEDDAEGGDWDVTGRITGLPWYEDGGRKLLHLAVAGSHREWSDEPYRLRARGSFSRGDRLIDSGSFDADSINLANAELALVYGPASLLAEYTYADIDPTLGDSESAQAYYILASYFLTGENRPYKNGVFTRVIPNNNFSLSDGTWGAWELAARYSYLDASEIAVPGAIGGELNDYAFGVNWYMNPNTRMMLNYIHSESEDSAIGDQDADIIQARLQIDF
ncbi:porin [bacterium]|nr:porin [bacterium]